MDLHPLFPQDDYGLPLLRPRDGYRVLRSHDEVHASLQIVHRNRGSDRHWVIARCELSDQVGVGNLDRLACLWDGICRFLSIGGSPSDVIVQAHTASGLPKRVLPDGWNLLGSAQPEESPWEHFLFHADCPQIMRWVEDEIVEALSAQEVKELLGGEEEPDGEAEEATR